MDLAEQVNKLNFMKNYIVILGLIFGFCVNAQESDSLKIIELEHKWVQVAIDQDADAFASMMLDDYKGLYSSGRFGSKEPWVKALRKTNTIYNHVRIYDLNVYIYENTAIVTGKYEEKAVRKGVESDDTGSYMNTWARIDGKWLLGSSAFTDDVKKED